MSALTKLVGDQVLEKGGALVDTAGLGEGNKVVGLYFSAHWCPPCRGFTPQLAAWYEKMKGSDQRDRLEMIFISSDRDQESFDNYFKEMPWHALPYSDRERKTQLSKKFKVQGIPTLVFLESETGKIISKDGRSKVTNDPNGFPWPPKTLEQMLDGPLLCKDGSQQDAAAALKDKVTGIYFSAHWCGPCRGFTPKLVETYKKVKDAGKPFEVVFASWDQDEDSHESYYKDMPWLSFPYDDKRVQELGSHFEVDGIPCLILLDENKQVISSNARPAISSDPEGEKFPWQPPAIDVLSPYTASELNSNACLLFLTGGKEDMVAMAKDAMTECAKNFRDEFKAKMGGDEEMNNLLFFYQDEETPEGLLNSLQEFLGLTEKKVPQVVLIDVEEQHKFISPLDKFTQADINDLVAKFKAGTLEYQPIRGDSD